MNRLAQKLQSVTKDKTQVAREERMNSAISASAKAIENAIQGKVTAEATIKRRAENGKK